MLLFDVGYELPPTTNEPHSNFIKINFLHTFLVYEYMQNGSLAKLLTNEKAAKEFDWMRRIKVVRAVAHALS